MFSRLFGYFVFIVLFVCLTISAYADEKAVSVRDLLIEMDSSPTFTSMAGNHNSQVAYNNTTVEKPALHKSGFLGLGILEDTPKKKSPKIAFFLSAVLPGLGEFYAGSKKGFIFMPLEFASWYLYSTLNKDGKDLETEFRTFADAHWRFSSADIEEFTYQKWYLDIFATIDPLLLDPLYTTHDDSLDYINAHHDFEFDANGNVIKNQQYYEMIGKYDQFVFGWNDVYSETYPEGNESAESTGRDDYENMRNDSNKKLKNRDNALKFMLINRIVSAIDAARFAWKSNQSIEAAEKMVRMKMVARREDEHEILMLVFTKKF